MPEQSGTASLLLQPRGRGCQVRRGEPLLRPEGGAKLVLASRLLLRCGAARHLLFAPPVSRCSGVHARHDLMAAELHSAACVELACRQRVLMLTGALPNFRRTWRTPWAAGTCTARRTRAATTACSPSCELPVLLGGALLLSLAVKFEQGRSRCSPSCTCSWECSAAQTGMCSLGHHGFEGSRMFAAARVGSSSRSCWCSMTPHVCVFDPACLRFLLSFAALRTRPTACPAASTSWAWWPLVRFFVD